MSSSRPTVSRRAHRARVAFGVALAVATSVSLTACGESSSRYVANKSERVYLKIPRDWLDVPFSEDDIDRLEAQTSSVTLLWRAAASSDPGAEPTGADADFPLVFTAVYELDGQLNQKMSASLARIAASPTGFDPLIPDDQSQSDLVEVLDYNPLDFPDMNGTRVVFRSRASTGEDYSLVYDVSSAYDSQNFRLYVLQIGCNVRCYENNNEAITKVADSWLVKP